MKTVCPCTPLRGETNAGPSGPGFFTTKNDGIVNIGSHPQSGLQRAFKKPQIRSQLLFAILNLTALSERQADQMKNVEHIGRTC